MPVSRSLRGLGPVVLLQTANALSGIGNGVVVIAIPWLVLEETGSAALYGVIAVLAVLPSLIALPFVGAAIDRYGARWVSVISDVASAASVFALPVLLFADALSIPAIIALAVLGAVIDPAGFTARRSAIAPAARAAGIRPESVNGIHDAIFGLGWAAGPPLGAFLIAAIGPAETFVAAGVMFAGAAVAMGGLRAADAPAVEHAAPDEGRLAELAAGLRALWADRPLRWLTIVNVVLASLYMPTEVVALPVHFERLDDPTGLGIVLGALAGGYVLGAFSYGWLSRRLSSARIFQLALVGTAIAALPIAVLPPVAVMAVAGAVLGASWGPVSPLLTSFVQRRMPQAVQGRVFAVEMTLYTSFPPVMILVVGLLVDALGVDAVYLALGGAFAATALLSLLLPAVRRLDDAA